MWRYFGQITFATQDLVTIRGTRPRNRTTSVISVVHYLILSVLSSTIRYTNNIINI